MKTDTNPKRQRGSRRASDELTAFPRLRFGLVLAAFLFGCTAAAWAESAGDAQRLVEQLGSERFSDRAAATRELQRLGRDAIPQLVAGVRNNDAETRRRALFILHELAGSDDVADADAVFAALTKLAADSGSAAQPMAEETLREVRLERADAALDQLRKLGASVDYFNRGLGEGIHVKIQSSWRGTDQDVALITRVDTLQALTLDSDQLGDKALDSVAQLKQLDWLYLGSSGITGKGLARLSALGQLRTLSLSNSRLSDEQFAQLPPLASLEALGLDGTQLTDAGLEHLADFPTIRSLWLDQTRITSSGIARLTVLQDLTTLYISETNISGPGLAELHKLPQLRYISLKNCQLTPEDMQRLSGLTELDNLGLDHTNVSDEHLAQLTNLPKLRTLWLSKCPVTDEAVKHLSQFTTLQNLYLHGSEISEHGVKDLRKALPQCQVRR